MRFQEVANGYVAHAEADGRHFVGAEDGKQVVVAAAAEERSRIGLVGVEDFKDGIGVVIKTAGQGRVEFYVSDAGLLKTT